MQTITLNSSDGATIAARVYEPTDVIEGNEQETRLWPRMADWLRDMAAPSAA